jgi:5-methylcytosine-specific restriction endonuclease McrA
MRPTRRLLAILADCSRMIREAGPSLIRYKPLIGPAWGDEYALGTMPCTEKGLHAVAYFVAAYRGCSVIGFGASKEAAIEQARDILTYTAPEELEAYKAELAAEVEQLREKHAQMRESELRASKERRQAPSIPKRRRDIFDKSEGKCHYCGVALTLDGKWHIEHMQPRALLGSNDRANLVASCVSCNHKKRDLTAEEFIAKQRRTAT